MNPTNPMHWVALLVVVAFVVLPSAAALIGIYWHAAGVAEEAEKSGRQENRNTTKENKP